MSHEIKFRGKALSDGRWVYGYVMQIHKHVCIGTWCDIGGEATVKDELFQGYVMVDPATVGQFTGLKDKDGTEIFAGDIVTDSEGIAVVYFTAPSFICVDKNNEQWWLGAGLSYPPGKNTLTCTVVIGNRFDNPELLTLNLPPL